MKNNRVHVQRRIAFIIIWTGVVFILSAGVVNPWTRGLYCNAEAACGLHYDGYYVWAAVTGLLTIVAGKIFLNCRHAAVENVVVLFFTCVLFLMADRLLLAVTGLPRWKYDPENHYVNRPQATGTWGDRFDSKPIRFNRWGHHDDDFPLNKKENEYRGLVLGDSIAMGYGVSREETFSNRLEGLIKRNISGFSEVQIINTGVEGYATHQEYNILRRSLVYQPDFIAIGFCMNDIIEPFLVDKRFGGIGTDYHRIVQLSSRAAGYLLNETGFGRAALRMYNFDKLIDAEKQIAASRVMDMAMRTADDPGFSKNWEVVLYYLNKIYSLAMSENIRVVLLIFPHTFQLKNDLFKNPQKILTAHAHEKGVAVIDFTTVFEEILFDTVEIRKPEADGTEARKILRFRDEMLDKYFLDWDHLTAAGHEIVADRLYQYLSLPGPVAETKRGAFVKNCLP